MLQAYRQHVAERAALGIPPLPLEAKQVADLIELCFASTMDPDGEQYLRQMRSAARDASFLRWAPAAAERLGAPLSGYIWEGHLGNRA